MTVQAKRHWPAALYPLPISYRARIFKEKKIPFLSTLFQGNVTLVKYLYKYLLTWLISSLPATPYPGWLYPIKMIQRQPYTYKSAQFAFESLLVECVRKKQTVLKIFVISCVLQGVSSDLMFAAFINGQNCYGRVLDKQEVLIFTNLWMTGYPGND